MMFTSRPAYFPWMRESRYPRHFRMRTALKKRRSRLRPFPQRSATEMRTDAVIAVIVAAICILIYIWFRFKDIRFAGSAVIALMHDVLVVFACYAIMRISVGNTFIACMLTIVGYSINATIVIFDRIRENLASMKNAAARGRSKYKYYRDTDEKYLYFLHNLCHGRSSLHPWCGYN